MARLDHVGLALTLLCLLNRSPISELLPRIDHLLNLFSFLTLTHSLARPSRVSDKCFEVPQAASTPAPL